MPGIIADPAAFKVLVAANPGGARSWCAAADSKRATPSGRHGDSLDRQHLPPEMTDDKVRRAPRTRLFAAQGFAGDAKMNVHAAATYFYEPVRSTAPTTTPDVADKPATDTPKTELSDADTSASEPRDKHLKSERAHGVLRLLSAGHFQSVAAQRLAANFADLLPAAGSDSDDQPRPTLAGSD